MTGFPWAELSTELALLTLGVVLVLLDALLPDPRRKHLLGYVTLLGLVLCLVPAAGVCTGLGSPESLFGGLYRTDGFHLFFRLVAVVVGIFVTLLSFDYLERIRVDRGVYFILLVFAVLAVVLLAGANDLIMVYLCFEYLSISSYVLAGFLLGRDKDEIEAIRRSAEAGLKYLIYGAVASGVMLYGFSLCYGLAGSTRLDDLSRAYAAGGNEAVKFVAVALVMVGLGFKAALVPFHQWAPDVYEGSPTPVAAFLAVGSKAAAFAVLVRFMVVGLGVGEMPAPLVEWKGLLAILAVATMFVGNILALLQSNIKRMLGYSSVAHAGYVLVGVICNTGRGEAGGLAGVQAVLIYLAVYLFMTTGAFAVVIWYSRATGSERIDDYRGLASRAPLMAFAMLIFMLGLTGLPPTGGFIGKLFILRAAVIEGHYWYLGLMIVINSVISAVYYINVARVMYFFEPEETAPLRRAFFSPAVVLVCTVVTIWLGLAFAPLWSSTGDMVAGLLVR